jgi:hypothetical protein
MKTFLHEDSSGRLTRAYRGGSSPWIDTPLAFQAWPHRLGLAWDRRWANRRSGKGKQETLLFL